MDNLDWLRSLERQRHAVLPKNWREAAKAAGDELAEARADNERLRAKIKQLHQGLIDSQAEIDRLRAERP